MKINKFHEMFQGSYDYDKILNILKKKYDWGFGIRQFIEDFESNTEYFLNPVDDRDYVEQFNIFLCDMEAGKMRGEFQNLHSIKLGNWQTGFQVPRPTSIYNKQY